jgi:ketosteroid isomerase-like protein
MKYFILFIVLFISRGNAQTNDRTRAIEMIKHQNEKLEQVVLTKNTDLLKEVYADSAYFLSPGEGVVHGRDSIMSLWKIDLDRIVSMKSWPLEVNGSIDCFFEVGIVETKIRSVEKDTVRTYRSKYNNVWVREPNGEYRLKVDIFNRLN